MSKPGRVRFWDTALGLECGMIKEVPGGTVEVAFSADGSLLAVNTCGPAVHLYRVSQPGAPAEPARAGPTPAKPFTPPTAELPREATGWWGDLASDDAERAYDAVLALADRPAVAVALLGQKLRPAAAPDRARAEGLVRELNSDDFGKRQQAELELRRLGEGAEPALRRALEASTEFEERQRIRRLLDRLGRPSRDPERLRAVRSAEVLELIATPEARRLLAWLATGAPEATLTREAASSLARLQRRPKAAVAPAGK